MGCRSTSHPPLSHPLLHELRGVLEPLSHFQQRSELWGGGGGEVSLSEVVCRFTLVRQQYLQATLALLIYIGCPCASTACSKALCVFCMCLTVFVCDREGIFQRRYLPPIFQLHPTLLPSSSLLKISLL